MISSDGGGEAANELFISRLCGVFCTASFGILLFLTSQEWKISMDCSSAGVSLFLLYMDKRNRNTAAVYDPGCDELSERCFT